MLRFYLFLALALAVSACATPTTDDFRIEDVAEQSFEVVGIKRVILKCYCREGVTVLTSSDKPASLVFTGIFDRVGYHGNTGSPDRIDASLMQFNVEPSGDALVIESKEWMYMHTAFLIKKLEITVPIGVEVSVQPIAVQELEGRHLRR